MLVVLAGFALPAAASQGVTPSALKQSSDVITEPFLVFPWEGAVLSSGLVYFQWEAPADPYGVSPEYGLIIRQGGANVRTFRTTQTFFALSASNELPPGAYTWLVVAYNAGGTTTSVESRFSIAGGGAVDAGIPDAGTAPDAGSIGVDAGGQEPGVSIPFDPTAPNPSSPLSESSGCSSSPAGGASPGALLLLLMLGLILRGRASGRRVRASPGP
jgi:MYXO-CTERM domain-containing protein